MIELEKENIQERKNKKINQKISELKFKEAKCSFCKKDLPLNKNKYLKNRYKLAFWNNQKEDDRLICYPCLKYGWTRGLPLIDGKTSEGGWSKKRLFRLYQKKGKFKENENA